MKMIIETERLYFKKKNTILKFKLNHTAKL